MCRFSGHNGEEWGSFMDVKHGGDIRGNLKGKSVLFGSVTDPYNPLEKRFRATRSALERMQDSGADIEILTKSPLVLRDIDLLKKIPNVSVGISLSTTDEKFVRLVEAHTSSPEQRINTLKELNKAGIPVYLFVSPIFPFLSDWKSTVDSVISFADKVCFENLNLRADYRTATLKLIEENYPELYPRFSAIYQNKIRFKEYWESEAQKIREHMRGRNYKIYFFHENIKKK